jgi:predicted kinase
MPCSGKSTYALRFPPTHVVSLDECAGLVGDHVVPCRPQAAMLFWQLVQLRLSLGRDVVVDRTCLTASTRKQLLEFARCYGARTEIVFFDMPLEIAERRNRGRPHPHSADVLEACHRKAERAIASIGMEGWDLVRIELP